ncbi:MAG: Gfo/Idh/MocA family oxidoreductase [Cephaloticoccus sp.]|nr:Gfo/Idh/MocA family oxidoreductase [Cephaloticoccus sp.]MCF7759529.1 Gfo/Idh/MocA family oxidoreductase [Cephaloticoccus sp.]
MLNIAIIGCGVIAQHHLRGLAKLTTARAAAVCDIRPEIAEKTAAEFGVARWETDAAKLFADPAIDAVILALPAVARTTLALEAFKHGKHVLTEKPVAMNAAEVRTMLAAQGDLVGACCSSRYQSFASAKAAREYIRSGGLGKIRTITCRAATKPGDAPSPNPPVWRLRRDLNGGGIFVNWGCYDVDYLLSMVDFKLTPQYALARTWQVPAAFSAYAAAGSDAETHITGLVTFAEGCVLTYERAEFSSLPAESIWQICGDRGALNLQMLKAKSANIVLTEPNPGTGTVTRVLWEGDESTSTLEHEGITADFAAAILEKRKPMTSLQDALLFARIADAFYASADSGQPVSFE